ncbi:MAG: hypothetical protein MI799_23215, partial [Desulfobacterales bacterium]|nr:hypothetical protein [Desulfobacterales bacterium]
MIRLKRLLIDINVPQESFAAQIGVSRDTVIRVCIHDYMPKREIPRHRLKDKIETWVTGSESAMAWLSGQGLEISAIWDRYTGRLFENTGGNNTIVLPRGNPLKLNSRKDIEMILSSTMKHYKLFKNPFLNDVTSEKDIFMSSEHRFLKEMMLDSAKYGGFVAVVGGVGSGKSVMRRAVAAELMSEGIK